MMTLHLLVVVDSMVEMAGRSLKHAAPVEKGANYFIKGRT